MRIECRMIGSNAFSCSWPASAAIVTVTSCPTTANAIWFTTSGITGLTLPGMIDDPAWRGGSTISPKPACGPEDSSRRSLQIFDSFTAARFSTPGHLHEDAGVARRLDQVARGDVLLAEQVGEVRLHGRGVARVGGDAGADRGRAEVDLAEQRQHLADALLVLPERGREAVELLAERHRHGVLQLGPARPSARRGTRGPCRANARFSAMCSTSRSSSAIAIAIFAAVG